jgi:hypothetical protein
LRSSSISLISIVLFLLIISSNLTSIKELTNLKSFSQNITSTYSTPEIDNPCPTPLIPSAGLQEFDVEFRNDLISPKLNQILDKSVWTIEHPFDNCYLGKYPGQFLENYYCDNLLVSRYELRNSGEINYRWYTAVTAVWKPQKLSNGGTIYHLEGFKCENGKKVTIEKGVTNYYVYDARDGKQIKIAY